MRRQFDPLPRMYPRQPSSFHIFIRVGQTPRYACEDLLCIWKSIFIRSRGDTTVRDTHPAMPPAMKFVMNVDCIMLARLKAADDTAGAVAAASFDVVSVMLL